MKIKKIIVFALAAALLAACFAGCSPAAAPSPTPAEPSPTPRVITDLAGNKVTLPEKIERVLITSIWPLPAVYCYHRGSAEGLIGIPGVAASVAKQSVLSKMFPEILELPTGFIDGTAINIEEVIKLKPDVVFYTGERQDEYEMLKNAGIAAVGFTTAMKGDGNVNINIADWLEQLDAVFGASENSRKLTDYNDAVLAELQEKLAGVQESEKPRVLIIFSHSSSVLQVAGKGHYSDFWISSAGAVNAADVDKLKAVDIEQILAWDPDIIYITNFCATLPEELINNTVAGYDWSRVRAVQEGKVYKLPLGTYRAYAPTVESSVVLRWMAYLNNPELFEGRDIAAEITEFYREFYGYAISPAELDAMLAPSSSQTQGH